MIDMLRDARGVTAVEFALTAPAFLLALVGLTQLGFWMWSKVGLQHATEMAARCASINTTICGNATNIQNYAAGQALGLRFSPSIFVVSQTSCGNQVSASYVFASFAPFLPNVTIEAHACFPN